MVTRTHTKANIHQMKFGQFYIVNGQVLRYSRKDHFGRPEFTRLVDGGIVVEKFKSLTTPEIFNY